MGGFVRDFGRWLAWNIGWFMTFFFIIPLAQPQKAGSWVRMAFIIPDNMGLTYYEFYGAVGLVLFLVGYVFLMRPSK